MKTILKKLGIGTRIPFKKKTSEEKREEWIAEEETRVKEEIEVEVVIDEYDDLIYGHPGHHHHHHGHHGHHE